MLKIHGKHKKLCSMVYFSKLIKTTLEHRDTLLIFFNGILHLVISDIDENSQNAFCFGPLLYQNFYHVQNVIFVRKTFNAFTFRRKGRHIRCSSL